MTGSRLRPAFFVGLFLALLVVALQGVQSEQELEVPPEDLCRPYIEKALKDLGTGSLEQTSAEVGTGDDKESHEEEGKAASEEEAEPTAADVSTEDLATEENKQESIEAEAETEAEAAESAEQPEDEADEASTETDQSAEGEGEQSAEAAETEQGEAEQAEGKSEEADAGTDEDKGESPENVDEDAADSSQDQTEEEKEDASGEETQADETKSEEEARVDDEKPEEEAQPDETKSEEEGQTDDGKSDEEAQAEEESAQEAKSDEEQSEANEAKTEEVKSDEEEDSKAEEEASKEKEEAEAAASKEEADTEETEEDASKADEDAQSREQQASAEEGKEESAEGQVEGEEEDNKGGKFEEDEESKSAEEEGEEEETEAKSAIEEDKSAEKGKSEEEEDEEVKSRGRREAGQEGEAEDEAEGSEEAAESEEEEPTPEEDLIQEIMVPETLRPRDHINQLLKLDEENEEKERAIQKIGDVVLKELKRVYDNAIQPLESLYKYRDLSNRHFGDPEIFSKPLVLFMGPWSGGKSSIINYLLENEYKRTSLRTGAEPSPAYFNILMHGEEEEILDGTQLAADWTFSGLQKFGQGMLDRLKGLRLDNKLLEKVNIVEIPGILEIRKQVQRLFPFNDACQWFIDRADIIFLVYDPSKLDVGPETEAILDQLKGREYQTRIILNKADQVKPEELMRVQGALIWNISPLMSSAEPPIMYSTSLWSLPYEAGAPTRLLYAQERAFLRDLRTAIDKRVEHKIASARRFAVRVRNHAKMVDCYLTTYYNHKTFFGNKKEISDKIIENPQDYHIYEGLSTLKNISRYDLPDPDVYRDFFRLNPLYDFPLLSSTCTYFRGCPINRLDVAIAYELPELVGKYKKSVEQVTHEYETSPPS
ncbi:neurofilament medium polypeptide [Hylaeus volcanicus]|uniref:neurofilament medium polypeptide n=1 Tax=Hylaeus volcanicus TaxID=313075 RepID=UPI0023B7E62F|nr:neurofilament medium polypeptide [Hylaeus volcanicus]